MFYDQYEMLKLKFKTFNLIANCLNKKLRINESLSYLIKANEVAVQALDWEQRGNLNASSRLSGSEWMQRGLAETHFNIASGLAYLKNYQEALNFLQHSKEFALTAIS